jgi:tannase
MRLQTGASAVAFAAAASASSLSDVCTLSNVKSALPSNGTILGVNVLPSLSTANTATSQSYSYCNVTVTYTHPGKGDTVVVQYALPEPSDYKKRFYVAGGGGYSLSPSEVLPPLVTVPWMALATMKSSFTPTALSTGTPLTCSATRRSVR